MRELAIACAGSSKALSWKNTLVTWEDLCGRLKDTIRTEETAEEYQAMSRDEREKVKDRGGFVGGYLKDGRRRREDVVSRSILTLDADDVKPGFIDYFVQGCGYAAVIYTTHSHTPEAPRVRVVIPFAKDISPDRYDACARYYAAEWGIDQFDVCSYRPNQLMYWPTTPLDGEYVCRVIEGPFMDPEEFLSRYPDWRDCSKRPMSSREKEKRRADGKELADPLAKTGIVGAFCRTYGIREAIDAFLSEHYAPSAVEGRYDFIPGEGSAGVVIYDDKFAYSHHGTDPAGGRLLNAFDLVRIHRFGDDDPEASFRKMCCFAQEDPMVKKTMEKERLEEAQKEFEEAVTAFEEPIPFGRYSLDPFPVGALPPDIGQYVEAVSESTQTPVDMAGTAALALISVCIQGKYVIKGKADWTEPLNTFVNIIASPSERKSAVLQAVAKPLDRYEEQYNQRNAAKVEGSRMRKRILERTQRALEDRASKGKAEPEELERIAEQIAEFEEEKPLHLYVDDITTEKLVSVMASNRGRAALVSSEGGIFDTLAGIYTKNVNIDVMLKGYSGDTIRVDRIGRESESVMNPSLTILLMTQPKVVSEVLDNATFRGRGLTARFLYCLPTSTVGKRQYRSRPVPEDIYRKYEQKMINMLEDPYPSKPETITLSAEASGLLAGFAEELEPKLKEEYSEIADWAGKLVGNILRIAGLLCRADNFYSREFLSAAPYLVVNEQTMMNAIRLGRYFLSHALVVYDVIPVDGIHRDAERILKVLKAKRWEEFDRRMAMRACQHFKKVSEIQPVLDFLDDYGYIMRQPENTHFEGRPSLPKYTVNPAVLSS